MRRKRQGDEGGLFFLPLFHLPKGTKTPPLTGTVTKPAPSLCPSCPASLRPNERTAPSAVRTSVCAPPAATATGRVEWKQAADEGDAESPPPSPPPETSVKWLREEHPPCPRRPWSPLPQVATARQVLNDGPSGAQEAGEEEVEVATVEARHAVEDDEMHRRSERPRVAAAAAARARCDTALVKDIKRISELQKSRRRYHRASRTKRARLKRWASLFRVTKK